jgi:alpha-1,2-mannosyltransferase
LQLKEEGIRFVRLRLCGLLKDSSYPRLTLLGQILGSMVVGLEAALKANPCSVLIDTLGNAFAYPAIRLLWPSVRIVAYTHYPFISGEMIGKVARRETAFNNAGAVSSNPLLTAAKVAYYRVLLWIYGLCGSLIDVAMANSSWTKGHLEQIWPATPIHLVYPPCDVEPFLQPTDGDTGRSRDIVSLSQFRPEKGHRLQLEAFALFCKNSTDTNPALIMVGGCRDEADRQRVNELKQLADQLGIADRVQFKTDLPFDQVTRLLRAALIGLHTMREEHFGISVVEFMAAGLVTLAHGSGGPKADIIEPGLNGFLAIDAEGYARALAKIYSLGEGELDELRRAAREKATTAFSMQAFHQRFLALLDSQTSNSPKGKQLT